MVKIRRAFIQKDENHTILSADYSQIELRIVASVSEDENMIEAFKTWIFIRQLQQCIWCCAGRRNPGNATTGEDGQFRNYIRDFAFGLAQRLGIPRSDAAGLIEQYFIKYSGIKKYMDDTIQSAREKGYVETLLGRRRYLRDINAGNWTIRGFAERNAINAPIQGTAADMIKVAMINIHNC